MKQLKRLSGLLLLALLTAALSITAFAAQEVELAAGDTGVNAPFDVVNMFPGDAVTQDYTVQVRHKDPVVLHFRADVRDGFETLAEVMMIRVELPGKGVTLYDGLMRDMPASVDYTLARGERSLDYRITAYLDTSVGNDYQNQQLKADFRWWYLEDTGGGGHQPNPGSVTLRAEKLLAGVAPKGSDFSFTLSDENGNVLQTVKNKGGDVTFKPLSFSQTGTHTYTIREVVEGKDGIVYDETVYTATVTVTKGSGKYIASVTYSLEGEVLEDVPVFRNLTKDPGGEGPDKPDPDKPGPGPGGTEQYGFVRVKLVAEKFLDGVYPQSGRFTFTLTDENGQVVQTVHNREGLVEFAAIPFAKTGIYRYTIRELPDTDGVGYDDTVYTAVIRITAAGGKLQAAVTYEKDGKPYELIPRFKNYSANSTVPEDPSGPDKVHIKLVAEKFLNGQYPVGSDYAFALTDSRGNVLQTVNNRGGIVEFAPFAIESAGTHTYYLKEVIGSDDCIRYDGVTYKVTATVRRENGNLVAAVSYTREGKTYQLLPQFSNQTKLPADPGTPDPDQPVIPGPDTPVGPDQPELPGDGRWVRVKLLAEKFLDGKYPLSNRFTFVLYDAEGNELQRVRNREGLVDFAPFWVGGSDRHVFYIRELAGSNTNVTYDDSIYKVFVTVTYEDGKAVPIITYEKDWQPWRTIPRFFNFTKNTTQPEDPSGAGTVHVKLAAEVFVNGVYPTGSDYAFVLTDENGNVLQTVNNLGGIVEFAPLAVNKPGEYVYYLKQLPGSADGATYDDTVYKVIVSVTEEDGRLVVSVSYEKDGAFYGRIPQFFNTAPTGGGVTPPGPVDPDQPGQPEEPGDISVAIKLVAEKLLDGQYARGDHYSFVLTDEQGNVLQTVRNRDGYLEFDAFYLTTTGDHVYYMKELAGEDADLIYDDTVYKVLITVSVRDGKALAHISYEKDGQSYRLLPRFHNLTKEASVPVGPGIPGLPDADPDNPKEEPAGGCCPWCILFCLILMALAILMLIRRRFITGTTLLLAAIILLRTCCKSPFGWALVPASAVTWVLGRMKGVWQK